ncbi:AraC family transcriptional regulator [Flavivirga rizhaonensis]|uniref:Helix-turn-helix domain-containing protein n=1 Tax=Flavivirga rizhaonensis TaxID=2559571 RepID=A0A4S1E124_9FLAO|nr:helix-turn-helix domain-containing protein [Flavivirga rizhaonensis]TGV03618.1 helix-turn-helix domain-containing protein [Flavivirga rizhaonensis]
MCAKNKNERIGQINKMLLEMASGNLFCRLELSSENDDIEALTLALNMLAEEIQESFLHQGYVNRTGVIKHIVQMSFLLDHEGVIQMVNKNACTILSLLYADIIEKSFDTFLTKASKAEWQDTWRELQQKGFCDTSLKLDFKISQSLLLPACCYVTTYKNDIAEKRKTLVTIVLHSREQNELEDEQKLTVVKNKTTPKKQRLIISYQDIKKIQKGRDIIVNNLEKELPSLKEFASQLNTNEFKLKYGFKQLYGVSVYRFLKRERLRNAYVLVQHSKISIKTIAYTYGFKSASHFSRAFKKRYGSSPNIFRKQSSK